MLMVLSTAFIGRYFFLPDIRSLKTVNPEKTSFMRYRELQWKKRGEHRRAETGWVPYGCISPFLVKAVVVSEDAKFWRHHGFDLAEMKNAARENIASRKVRFGASTISQQLVKNLYLRPSKNILRKTAEAVLTWRLERTLGKRRILEIYLNVAEWGDGIFGAQRAARHYFGKSAAELTAEEAARLAVILPSPLHYNPKSTGGYIERRSAVILKRMFPVNYAGKTVDTVVAAVETASGDSLPVPPASDSEIEHPETGDGRTEGRPGEPE